MSLSALTEPLSIGEITQRNYDPAERLAESLAAAGLPAFHREFQFCSTRKWRFDFAWPGKKVALEFEGAVFQSGRHTRGAGFTVDCHKYNTAALLGWKVFRVTTAMAEDGTPNTAVSLMRVALS